MMGPGRPAVSWIAGLLPYLGHADWQVETAYNWNGVQNNPVTKRSHR